MIRMNRPLPKHQQGLSLAELMIALVLGLLIISAVVNTYVGTVRSSDFSRGMTEMQENGRFGITTLQRGIRLAGYAPDGQLTPIDIAQSSETSVTVSVTDLYDCNGQSTAAFGGIATNTYAHNPADNTITCKGNTAADAMAVVEGVDAMRILWGVDTDENDIPDQYISYNAGIDADSVIALRIAILVGTSNPIRSRSSQETYVLLDDEVTIGPDKVARTVFTSTVELRNRTPL